MSAIDAKPRARELLAPMWQPFEAALASLPTVQLCIDVGEVEGFASWVDDTWVLSSALEGPELRHPDEPSQVPLDRWRRAMGAALEGVAWASLVSHGATRGPGWWQGAAVAAADAVAPFLELGLSARRDALAAGSLRGRHAALLFADAPLDQARRWLDMIEGAEVRAALARALADPDLRPLPDPIALPLDLPAWCFARVRADRPGRLADLGLAVGPEPAWVAVFEDRRLELAPVGVEGRWDLASTDVPGNILGARGVTMRFYASGRVDLLFADAFVGPLAALEIARQMGHSGMTSGTWQAVGPSRIRFGRFGAAPITMHQRDGSQAMPQVGFGVTEWVAALEGSEWRVERGESELVLDGRLMDMPVRLRLVPERD